MEARFLDRFPAAAEVPAGVDLEPIQEEWLALRPPYRIEDRHLPAPVWARRPFTDSGAEAWHTLALDLPLLDPGRATCIYLHIPFCSSRCRFCDCYAFRLAGHKEREVASYLALLEQEMDLWSRLGTLGQRRVSTVHLGGGTPTFLGVSALERLVQICRDRFAVGPATEWALESTVADLSTEMMESLDRLSFTRLHLGVQSLQDEVRRRIGRRTDAAAVVRAIEESVRRGWIVSVDLIYGLPGQTPAGLLDDIRTLAGLGINGFSLYELQFSSRNLRFVRESGLDAQDRGRGYLLGQVASRCLQELGYGKTLFNHFADARDTNLYFTFPARDEDCLALGTVADGSFGDYHYRHGEYAAYRRSAGKGSPGLEGGLRRTAAENALQPLTVGLLAGSIPAGLFCDDLKRDLLVRWLESRLLTYDAARDTFRLTGNGSWFVGNMISEMMVGQQAPEV